MKEELYKLLRNILKVKSLTHYKNRYKRKLNKIFYKKKFSDHDLEEKLKSFGVVNGDVVFIHSSWDEFYNYNGTPETFIDLVLNIIGEDGTLVMPSYPLLRKKDSIFSLKTTPTLAGLLPEVFRNYKKVERSLDFHSVAAFGKLAKFITESHIHSKTSWDEMSPYFKLSKTKAKVFSMGLGKHHVGTIMHCADSLLRTENEYFDLFFKKQKEIQIKKLDGEIIIKKYLTKEDNFYYNFTELSHWGLVKKHFDKSKYKLDKISNLNITMFDAEYTINKSIELARKGIVVYTNPNPKNYKFDDF